MLSSDLFAHFQDQAMDYSQQTFLRLPDEMISYESVAESAHTFGSVFDTLGISDGDVVGIFMENRPEFIYALFGAFYRGALVACINTDMRGEGLAHLVKQAGVDVVVSTDDLLAETGEIFSEAGVDTNLSVTVGTKYTPISSEMSDISEPERLEVTSRDSAVLLHTSGTTGLPKWCDISHEYLYRLGEYVSGQFEIAQSDTVFNPLPLYHINPLGYYLFGSLHVGATLGMVEQFSVSQFWDQARMLDATVAILHMAPKDMILDRTTADDAVGHNLRVVFPADREFMHRYDIPKMVTGYGSTEAGGLTHTNKFSSVPSTLPDEEDLSQSAGQSRCDISFRIVDEDGTPVPTETQGEILVRPDRPGVIFDGYYGEPEKTVDAWDGLWYNTGDLGYVDEEGLLHFVGRISDSISHKGQFVNVDLVESVLESHFAVEQVVVVGVPDDVVGERVKACIIPSGEIDPEKLVSDVTPDLPEFMLPEYVEYLDAFPRIEGTEKINRTALREKGTSDAQDIK